MALSANTVLEIRTTGSDTNGGGFVAGASGTDWSQQASTQYSVTNGVTNGTTTITSATANFGTDVVGNLIYVQGGTGSITAGWYQIISRTNSTTIVVDRSTGLTSGTGVTLHIGGALASPGQAAAIATVSGMTVYQKAGTYTINSASTNIAGGCVALSTSVLWEGYNSSRGDLGTAPLLQASGISTAVLFAPTTECQTRNIAVDGAGLTSIKGFNAGRGTLYRCKALNCTNNGFAVSNAGAVFVACAATGCSTQPAFTTASVSTFLFCEAYANTINGFTLSNANSVAIYCISDGNTGATTDGFLLSANGASVIGCVAYGNGRHGFSITGNDAAVQNCIAEGNTGTGFSSSTASVIYGPNAVYNNGTNVSMTGSRLLTVTATVTGTGSFFTNAASRDFSLNNTSGAGASARAVGFPGAFLAAATTGYQDIGVAQHADPAQMLLNPSLEGL